MQMEYRRERFFAGPLFQSILISIAGVCLLWSSGISMAQQPGQKRFASPEEASRALFKAVQNNDLQALMETLGPAGKELIFSGDEIEDKNDRDRFVQKYLEMHRLAKEPDETTTLYIGAENWPLPIPLVNKGEAWFYDLEAGKQEILFRRIGQNELAAIRICRELVDAQKEYESQLHDNDPIKQYAQKMVSDEGKRNGLYWKPTDGAFESPIGSLIASASNEGTREQSIGPTPFLGYHYRVLTRQGKNAPGGIKDYIVGSKMTRGFAFIAYPANYGISGVMTFIVNQDGIVYEKDLGSKTADLAKKIQEYDPDSSWRNAE